MDSLEHSVSLFARRDGGKNDASRRVEETTTAFGSAFFGHGPRATTPSPRYVFARSVSPLSSPFLLAAVDALDSLFSPFHHRIVVSFSIPLRSVARASETTRKRRGRTGLGERDRDGRIEIRTARHQTPAIRLVLKRREKDGKRSGLCARKERQDRWEREEGWRARTKRRCQRDDETKQRENGFRTNTRPGTLASSERNYRAHARIAFLLSLFYFSPMLSLPPTPSPLSFSPLRSLCYLL